MLQMFQKAFRPSRNDSLSHSFSRLGWLGFWMQVAVGAIPLALTIYALVFGRNSTPGTRAGFPLIEYLSIAGLLVLAFAHHRREFRLSKRQGVRQVGYPQPT
jgi:uncharacterized protein DUF3611